MERPMQQPDSDLGQCVIAPHPADHDPRESAVFAQLQGEIQKLASLHAGGPTDWPRVAQLADQYLREQAKDLTVGVWLAAAWLHTAGAVGAQAAARVLTDLVRGGWDDLLPARARARRNQLVWLEEIVERYMSIDDALAPASQDAYASMVQAWRDLDAEWRARDEDAPSFAGFALRLSQWPVEPDAPADPAPAESVASPEAPVNPAAPVVVAEWVTPASASTTPTATNSPVSMTPAPAAGWDSADALERAFDQSMDSWGEALESGVRDFPAHPLWYRLNRVRVWAALEQAPAAQQGETRIPAPQDRLRERLSQLMAGSDYVALLLFAESQLGGSRFWLDLNLASFTALSQLPDGQAAATAIAQETATLLSRLPTLAALRFSDGTPFADERTRDWLASHAPARDQVGERTVSAASPRTLAVSAAPANLMALSAAIAAATAQTESAQTLLSAALSRLHDSALQVASHAFTERPLS
jgi:type VI secretion system protein VasJ